MPWARHKSERRAIQAWFWSLGSRPKPHDRSPIGRHSRCGYELPAGDVDARSLEESLHALHSGGRSPADGSSATAVALADHDRAIGVHAIGYAEVTSRQKAEADHAPPCRPAEGLPVADAVGGLTDHDRAGGVYSSGFAMCVPRQEAEADRGVGVVMKCRSRSRPSDLSVDAGASSRARRSR